MNDQDNLKDKMFELYNYIKIQIEKVKNKEETKEGAYNGIANKFKRVEIIKRNVGTTPLRDKPSAPEGTETLLESYKRLGIDKIIVPSEIKKREKDIEEFE